MTNPSNAIGTNGAYGGRTSVEALNDILNVFTGGGIVRGWECSPSSGMTVALGGVSGYRDVAIAVSPTGTRTTINNRTTSPVNVTLSTAPASNSRIDVIVAYAQNPPQGSATVVDNPAACGIIPVSGTVSSSPTAPSDSDIRSAITADGGTGSTAYYVVLATITVASGVTTITSNYITQGAKATLGTDHIADGAVTTAKLNSSAVTNAKIADDTISMAKMADLNSPFGNTAGTYTMADRGILFLIGDFQLLSAGDGLVSFTVSGASGGSYLPIGSQYSATQYTRGTFWGMAFVAKGDSVTIGMSVNNAQVRNFDWFLIPMNW